MDPVSDRRLTRERRLATCLFHQIRRCMCHVLHFLPRGNPEKGLTGVRRFARYQSAALPFFDLPFAFRFRIAPPALIVHENNPSIGQGVTSNPIEVCGHPFLALSAPGRRCDSHGREISFRVVASVLATIAPPASPRAWWRPTFGLQ